MFLIEPTSLRKFGLLMGGIFALIGLSPLLLGETLPRIWAVGLAMIVIGPALVWPRILAPLYRVWMQLAYALGWINTRIILSLVFYGLVTPLGLLGRGRTDSLRLQFDSQADSYRVQKQCRPASHMLRQF